MRIQTLAAALIAAPALVVVVGPYWLGGRAELAYRTTFAEIRGRPQVMQVLREDYRRGWFSSKASLELVPSAADQGTDLRLRIDSDVAHGPRSLEGLNWPPALAEIRSRLALEHPDFHLEGVEIDTRLAWDGGGASQLRLPAMDLQAAGEAPGLRSAAATGMVRFEPGGSTTGHLDLPSLELVGADGAALLVLRDLQAEHSTTPWLPGILVGTGKVTVSEAYGSGATEPLVAEDLAFDFEAQPEDGLLGVRFSYGVGVLSVGDADYGPSRVEFRASRLDGAALSALQQDLGDLNAQALPEAMAGVAAVAVLMKHLPALVAADPQLALNRLEVVTPQGPIQGRLAIGTQGLTGTDLMVGAWLERLVADGELNLPRSIAVTLLAQGQRETLLETLAADGRAEADLTQDEEQALESVAATQLELLVQGGWVKDEGGRLTSVLKLADGVLTINGKPLPLPLSDAVSF
jgi:uncharacterized protein YdgA (DUF945 family)